MNIFQIKVLKIIKINTMKRPIIIVGHTYNFTDKIKCYFNTNNTYYTYNQTLSKLSLMSPTSYQTAPPRDIKFSNYSVRPPQSSRLTSRKMILNHFSRQSTPRY